MAISGTTSFAPSIGELALYALGLCGIRRTEITQQHLSDAYMAANLMLAEWNNDTPNLWKVSLVTQALTQGVATYSVDPSCIMILDAYIRTNDGQADENDRIIWPISRTEYASVPNKETQAPPTVFWFDRLLSPTVTLWQVPDGNGPYLLKYYSVTQIYDAGLAGGETPDIPVWWFSAFAYGLASRIADSWAPDHADRLEAKAQKYLTNAREQNVENVPLMIAPSLYNYYIRR
jgi:hypothetical protein